MTQGKHSKHTNPSRKGWLVAAILLGVGIVVLVAVLGLAMASNARGTGSQLNYLEESHTNAGGTSAEPRNSTNAGGHSLSGSEKDKSLPARAQEEAERAAKAAQAEKEAAAQYQAEAKAEADAKAEAIRAAEEAKQEDFSPQITSAYLVETLPSISAADGFALNPARSTPSLSAEELAALDNACQAIEDAGYHVSCLFVDLHSGQGIASHAQEAVYTASSFKAPLADYLLESGNASEWEMGNIEASILYSDNDAFEALATPHMDQNYQDWLAAHAIEYDGWSPWYPHASALGMAACWTDIYHYLEAGSETALWFKELLANTNLSFIRNALDGESIQVWNKGGWLSDPEYNAVADCGIIEADGRKYLLCVLTDQPSWGEAHERVYEVIRALWACRESLR